MKQILFLSQVFPKVKCYCHDDDKTLYDVLEGSIDTEELHGYFQQLEHQHADQNTGDLTTPPLVDTPPMVQAAIASSS